MLNALSSEQTKCGQISIADLQEVLLKFNLPAEPEIVIQLMYYCDKSSTGFIDYTEFSNFLNWKEKMPSGLASGNITVNYYSMSGYRC